MYNFYKTIKSKKVVNPGFDQHGVKVPFRMLIAAPSGAGKTNCLMNLLSAFDKTFHEIIVCVLSDDEPLYQRLGTLDGVIFYTGGEVPEMPAKNDGLQRLIIFDDLVLHREANRMAEQYFIKARKLGYSMCYISQSYFQTPKMIRIQCNILVLGKNLLKKDLRMILSVIPTEMTLDEFAQRYSEMTKEPMSVVLVDIVNRSFRKNILGERFAL